MTVPELETDRLLLRSLRDDDLDAYAAIVADPEVMRPLGDEPLDRAEAWRRLAFRVGHWELRGYGPWAVEVRATGELVGHVGLYRPEGWPGIEVGWTLGRPYWGHGYATEAGRASLEWGWRELDPERIVSLIAPANERSAAVAARLGLSRSGELFEHRGQRAEVWEILRPA